MQRDFIEGLDERQKEAVITDAPSLLVVAGPGSGKTMVLAARFAHLLDCCGDVNKVLAVTFTNRAAEEMKRRVSAMTRLDRSKLLVGTFHAFCLKFLKAARAGFSLYGRVDQTSLLREIGVKNADKSADAISAFKSREYPLRAVEDEAPLNAPPDEFYAYQAALNERNALDLDDLITETINSLEDESKLPGFSHVLVDEYQDINPAQARLIELLTNHDTTLTAIGDPDQAIYSFRGASVRAFLDFEKDRPGSKVIKLSQNYRSRARVVESSRAVIGNNIERMDNSIAPARGGGEVRLVSCPDERCEAEFIIKEIESRMGGLSSLTVGSGSVGERFSDFAVFTRTNRQLDTLVEVFKRSSIPFQVVGPPGPVFFDFLHHLKSRRLSPWTGLTDHIRSTAREIKADKELTDLFLRYASHYEKSETAFLDSFIEEMLLAGPADVSDLEADKVMLMTIHTSKGLEFKTVFIAGAEDGLLPLRLKGLLDMEEERRLFYVGMTRAKESLYLVTAKKRRLWGMNQDQRPSPFIAEIPQGLVQSAVIKKRKREKKPVQNLLFE